MIKIAGCALVMLAMGAEAGAAPAPVPAMRTIVVPPETIETRTSYHAARRSLTVSCDVASRGLCRITIADGPRRKMLNLRPKTRATIGNVSPKARVCARGRNEGQPCDWVPAQG